MVVREIDTYGIIVSHETQLGQYAREAGLDRNIEFKMGEAVSHTVEE